MCCAWGAALSMGAALSLGSVGAAMALGAALSLGAALLLGAILLTGAVLALLSPTTGAVLPLWVPHQWGCSGLCCGGCFAQGSASASPLHSE